MDKRIRLLDVIRDDNGDYTLTQIASIWAETDEKKTKNIFSNFSMGSAGMVFTVRQRNINKGGFIEYKGERYLITNVVPKDRMYNDIETAHVVVAQFTAYRNEKTLDDLNRVKQELKRLYSFPGILAEKYPMYEQREPQIVNTQKLVLITSKLIELKTGDKVDDYTVKNCRTLDSHKNEYELERKVEA